MPSITLSVRRCSLVAASALLLGLFSCAGSDPAAGGSAGAAAGAGTAGASNGGGGANSGGAGASNGGGGASSAAGSANGGATNGGAGNGGGGASSGSGGTTGGGAGGTSGSAGLAGGAGSAGAGGAAYQPCPSNGDACRIMPLGDSITDGCCGENTQSMGASYRLELFRLATQHNKKLTFVGSHSSGPNTVDNASFPKQQEGHPGWTISDGGGRSGLQQQIVGWLNATHPHIITLMIGTNDVDIQLDLANAPKRLGTLLDTITKTTPTALVVLARIVPTRKDDENARVRSFNDAMPNLVKTFTDAGKHVMLIDMYGAYTKNTAFKTALLANDLHPSDAGYAVMGNVWWDALGSLLPAK